MDGAFFYLIAVNFCADIAELRNCQPLCPMACHRQVVSRFMRKFDSAIWQKSITRGGASAPPGSVSKNYRSCHCDVVAVGDEGALRIRPLRLPVGAKRRGNLIQAVPNSPKSSKISKQFCKIATAVGGLAMTKSDLFDRLNPDAVYPAPGLSFSANTIVAV